MSRTFASLFPKRGAFISAGGIPCWRLRGSGVHHEPIKATSTRQVVELLRSVGIPVRAGGTRGICCVDTYTLKSEFLDGGLWAETGPCLGMERGAWVRGPKAAALVALGLGLRLTPAFIAEHRLGSVTFESLLAELRAGAPMSDGRSHG